jgi:FdhD protein
VIENNPAASKPFTISSLRGDIIETRDDVLAVETDLTIILDGEELANLMCSPGKESFLALGFLHGEGLVRTIDEVTAIEHDGEARTVRVSLTTPAGSLQKKRPRSRTSSGSMTSRGEAPGPARTGGPMYEPAVLMRLMEEFSRGSGLFARTGCVHSAALSDGRTLLFFAEDIGRHNTFDKAAGEAFAAGIDCTGKILFTSGRISSEVVRKAVHLGLAVIVSPSAPTSLAVELARTRGIMLLGFTRGDRANLY